VLYVCALCVFGCLVCMLCVLMLCFFVYIFVWFDLCEFLCSVWFYVFGCVYAVYVCVCIVCVVFDNVWILDMCF